WSAAAGSAGPPYRRCRRAGRPPSTAAGTGRRPAAWKGSSSWRALSHREAGHFQAGRPGQQTKTPVLGTGVAVRSVEALLEVGDADAVARPGALVGTHHLGPF